jgi:hypothetical protein
MIGIDVIGAIRTTTEIAGTTGPERMATMNATATASGGIDRTDGHCIQLYLFIKMSRYSIAYRSLHVCLVHDVNGTCVRGLDPIQLLHIEASLHKGREGLFEHCELYQQVANLMG